MNGSERSQEPSYGAIAKDNDGEYNLDHAAIVDGRVDRMTRAKKAFLDVHG